MEQLDTIVIGSGQAGTPLALGLAEAGRKTALIERQHIGGTCVNEGCTPTKTMVASARLAYLACRGADYGVNTGAVSVSHAKILERKRAIVASFRNGSQRRETRGYVKAVVDAQTKQILGAAVLDIEGGEIMSMLEVAIMGRLPYTALRDGIVAHPALAESLNNLFSTLTPSALTFPQPKSAGAA